MHDARQPGRQLAWQQVWTARCGATAAAAESIVAAVQVRRFDVGWWAPCVGHAGVPNHLVHWTPNDTCAVLVQTGVVCCWPAKVLHDTRGDCVGDLVVVVVDQIIAARVQFCKQRSQPPPANQLLFTRRLNQQRSWLMYIVMQLTNRSSLKRGLSTSDGPKAYHHHRPLHASQLLS